MVQNGEVTLRRDSPSLLSLYEKGRAGESLQRALCSYNFYRDYFGVVVAVGATGLNFAARSGVDCTSVAFSAFATSTANTYVEFRPNMLLVKNTSFLSGEKRTLGSR